MATEIGDRVGAIQSANENTVHFFGYGVYEGDHPYAVFSDDFLIPNPRILLDSGGHVYGAQCWWGDETEVKKQIGGREVIMVDIKREVSK